MVSLRPRPSSKLPMEADASPFPSDDTTPPVTKMNLVCLGPGLVGALIAWTPPLRLREFPPEGCGSSRLMARRRPARPPRPSKFPCHSYPTTRNAEGRTLPHPHADHRHGGCCRVLTPRELLSSTRAAILSSRGS